MSTNKRAIIYTRVSTDEQAEKGYSLRDQKAQLEKWCAEKQIQIVAHFQDDASAKTFERPEFKKLMALAKANKGSIDYLLVPKWDRFSRNATDAYIMIRDFGRMGITVNATQQWIDFSIPEQQFMLAIYVANSQVENEIRSNRTKTGMRQAIKEGRWVAHAPKGYKRVPDGLGKSKLEIDGITAPLVREAFEEIGRGINSVEGTRKRLYEKGFKCEKSQFPRLLRNVVYIGKIYLDPWRNEEAQVCQGIHLPLISEELFYRVQDVLEGNKKTIRRTIFSGHFPLKGFLWCVRCDKILTASFATGRRGGRFPYYHCQKSTCQSRYKESLVHQYFMEKLRQIKIRPSVLALFEKIFLRTWKDKTRYRVQESDRVQKQIKTLEQELFQTELKFVKGELEKDSYRRLKDYYDRELVDLRFKISSMSISESDYPKRLSFGLNLLLNLDEYYIKSPFEGKQKFTKAFFGEKMIFDGERLRTPTERKLVSLISCYNKDLGETKKAENFEFSAISGLVPPAIRLSNTLTRFSFCISM